MAIAEALANLPQPTITIDDQLSPSSTNPVQNKVIAEALQDVVTDDIIWEDIDASLSFENPDNDFSGGDLNVIMILLITILQKQLRQNIVIS